MSLGLAVGPAQTVGITGFVGTTRFVGTTGNVGAARPRHACPEPARPKESIAVATTTEAAGPASASPSPLHFSVLGPLTVTGPDGPLVISGARRRAVLIRLLVARGRPVPETVDQRAFVNGLAGLRCDGGGRRDGGSQGDGSGPGS